MSVSYETSSKSEPRKSPERACRTRLPPKVSRGSLQNERFVRDFLQKWAAEVSRTSVLCETSFKSEPRKSRERERDRERERARFARDFFRRGAAEVSRTSVSYETSSKSEPRKSPERAFCARLPSKVSRGSLQNERFGRDVFQKWAAEVCRTSVLCETSFKSEPRKSPERAFCTTHYHMTRTILAEGRSRSNASNAIDVSLHVWTLGTRDPRRGSVFVLLRVSLL